MRFATLLSVTALAVSGIAAPLSSTQSGNIQLNQRGENFWIPAGLIRPFVSLFKPKPSFSLPKPSFSLPKVHSFDIPSLDQSTPSLDQSIYDTPTSIQADDGMAGTDEVASTPVYVSRRL